MSPFRFVQSGLFATTLLITTPATAGWMDQLDGAVDTYNKATQGSTAPSTATASLTNSDMIAGLKCTAGRFRTGGREAQQKRWFQQ